MANPSAPVITAGPGGAQNTMIILRPTGMGQFTNGWVTFNGPSQWQVISDDTDATCCVPSTFGAYVPSSFTLPVFALPALAQVRYVQVRLRGQLVVGAFGYPPPYGYPGVSLHTPTGDSGTYLTNVPMGSSIGTVAGAAFTPGAGGGTSFDAAFLNVMTLFITPGQISATTDNLYEAYVDVWYNQAPVATVTLPAGTVTTSSRPTLVHSYTDPEGDVQERYRRKIFRQPAAGWPSTLDPTTGHYANDGGVALVPVVDYGEVFSPGTSSAMPISLINGNYRHYVQVSDVNSGGRYGPWAFANWTQNVPGPNAPGVTLTPSQATMSVAVGMTPAAAGPATTYFVLQRSDDGGVTWTTVIGGGRIATQ